MKKNQTRRALLLSALSLLLCCSMLVGTTFAWFTDSVTSGRNTIAAGNLDVVLEYWDGDSYEEVTSDTKLFNDAALWEPGYTEVAYLKVSNAGSLTLKYQLAVNVYNEILGKTKTGADITLSDHLQFKVVESDTDLAGTYASREAAQAAPATATKLQNYTSDLKPLDAKNEAGDNNFFDYVALIVYMPTTVDNAANHDGTNIPKIEMGVSLQATQRTYENDSFGPDYDALATQSGFTTGDAPAAGESKVYEVRDMESNNLIVTMNIHSDSVEDADLPIRISITPTEQNESVPVDEANQNAATFEITVENLKEDNQTPVDVVLYAGKNLSNVQVYHKDELVPGVNYDPATGFATFQITSFSPFTVVYDKPVAMVGNTAYGTIHAAFEAAEDGDVVVLRSGYNSTSAPLTESIVVKKNVTLNPNGMYLVSSAPATFTVEEGGKLTVTEGSFTIKNTYTQGAAVLLDGGQFEMQGGSFDAYAAVRTTEGKSSVATMTAGWSNRVTVAFDCKGNDTVNVLGGSIYSSAEAIKTVAGNHLTLNMSGGLLSSRTTQYSAAVNLQCPATVNMTGGKIENTYSSGYNGSPAIAVNVGSTTINLSGDAALSSNGTAVMLGSHLSSPAVQDERITLNMSGNASISATSQMGFGVRYAQDCCDVILSGNAKVNATYQAIQFNTNSYVYTNSTLLVSENATVTSTAGRIGGGYAIASNGHVTVTGGTINGSTAGIASFQEGAVVIIDNSQSGTPITVNKVDIAESVTYTVAGNPTIG